MKRVILLLLCSCLIWTMWGCGEDEVSTTQPQAAGQSSGSPQAPVSTAPIKACCEEFIKAYAAKDGETAGKLLNGDDTPVDFSGLSGLLAENMDPAIEIQDVSVSGDEATVQANVKNINISSVLTAAPDSIRDRDGAAAYLQAALEPGKNEKVVYPVSILLIWQGDQWRIQMTPSLSNALLAGYNDLLTEGMEDIER